MFNLAYTSTQEGPLLVFAHNKPLTRAYYVPILLFILCLLNASASVISGHCYLLFDLFAIGFSGGDFYSEGFRILYRIEPLNVTYPLVIFILSGLSLSTPR